MTSTTATTVVAANGGANTITYTVQNKEMSKNSGVQSAYTASEMAALFAVTDTNNCPILDYVVVDSALQPITSANVLFSALQLGQNNGAAGTINIDTTIEATSTSQEVDYEFWVKAVTANPNKYALASFKVTIGCLG